MRSSQASSNEAWSMAVRHLAGALHSVKPLDEWANRGMPWLDLSRPPASRQGVVGDALRKIWPHSPGRPADWESASRALHLAYVLSVCVRVARIQAHLTGRAAQLGSAAVQGQLLDEAARSLSREHEGAAAAMMEVFPQLAEEPAVRRAVGGLWQLVRAWDPFHGHHGPGGRGDFFGGLYQQVFPAPVRHALGEFYTPRWLVEAVLQGNPPTPGWNGLDPCCGSGAFVVGVVDQLLTETAHMPPIERLEALSSRFEAWDINPLALLTTRANLALALGPLLKLGGRHLLDCHFPVRLENVLDAPQGEHRRFERVVGNPPWVAWRDLSAAYRQNARIQGLDASGSPSDTYVGGTDVNVCVSIAQATLEARVSERGVLSFLMPRQLLQSRAARNFRRWAMAEHHRVCLRSLDDWTALRPFDAACAPVSYVFQRGIAPLGEIPLRVWRPRKSGRRLDGQAPWIQVADHVEAEPQRAYPSAGEDGGYVLDSPAHWGGYATLFGRSAYRGRRAVETSPHSIFWLRLTNTSGGDARVVAVENDRSPRARICVQSWRGELETDCLYPLLRGRDIQAFHAAPRDELLLLPHRAGDGARAIESDNLPPRTRAYLAQYEDVLRTRASFREYLKGQPYYALWRVGPYTFEPFKVVWPELGALRAAVVSQSLLPWGEWKLVIPEGKVNVIAASSREEAHFVCAWLNAPLVRAAYVASTHATGRPAVLPFAIPPFDSALWTHRALAGLSALLHGQRARIPRAEPALDWLVQRCLRLRSGL